MGVQGLWTILAPCARPIKLETLAHKRLAVDASIWIYQFLKAVRDKEGNALHNSHVVGFFRRICKLLFFGIKPVFVFDGGAPVLKRRTIAGRKTRREGRKDDAARTAGRLLAIQMKRRLEEQVENKRKGREQRKRDEAEGWENSENTGSLPDGPEEEPMPEIPVYVEELGMTLQEQKKNRFRKQDPYHLPDLDISIENMGAPNDHRIMSPEELAAYAAQFREQGDNDSNMSLYDFSKIDFSSPFFLSLPIGDQYAILSAARLRSRLRLGLSKEQLAQMFPNRLDFSRFQIERVRERNELTQRLMTLVGMNTGGDSFEAIYGAGRIAGEKGREYMLVKNDGAEGGWVLGVVGRKEGIVAPPRHHGGKHVDRVAPGGDRSNPIILDANQRVVTIGDDGDGDDDDDEVFEDVPIEGLNRVPKLSLAPDSRSSEAQQLQQAIQNSINERAPDNVPTVTDLRGDNDSLFISTYGDEVINDLDMAGLFSPDRSPINEAEENMQIQETMEKSIEEYGKSEEDEMAKVIELSNQDYLTREGKIEGTEKATVLHLSDEESEDGMDLQAAMKSSKRYRNPHIVQLTTHGEDCSPPISPNPFGGMLPFEALDIGFKGSLLEKKKNKSTVATALSHELPSPSSRGEAHFVKEDKSSRGEEEVRQIDKDTLPLPPWFRSTTDIREDLGEQGKLRGIVDAYDTIPDIEQGDAITVSSHGEAEDNNIEMIDNLRASSMRGLRLPEGLRETNKKPWYSGSTVQGEAEAHEIGQGIGAVGSGVTPNSKVAEPHGGTEVSILVSDNNKGQIQVVSDEELEWDPSGDEEYSSCISSTPLIHHFDQSLDPAVTKVVYSDPEEEDLILQLRAEAKEHARFAAALTMDNIGKQSKPNPLTEEEYEHELNLLQNQQRKDRRDADEVTQTMISECQELLKLFGLPYITAPMEAEAQCAELVRLCLVDGIVTDDSDCFLFGGTRVYKNMFHQEKFVECYLLSDLEKEFSLDRKKLVSLAHLLGSDYTEGLPGIGPVTALELLTEFSIVDANDEEPVAPLRRFRKWWDEVQYLGGITYSGLHDSPFKKKFRKSHATKLSLQNSFPSCEVDEAYLKPEVDQDPSMFQWGVPDLDGLRRFLMSTIGWSQGRCDEVLVPVIKDMNRRLAEGTQSNITRFFEGGVGVGAFAPRKKEPKKSKRMDRAFQQLHRITSKRTGGADAHYTSEQDRPTGLTPVSMKDATSGRLSPITAATVGNRKVGRSKETDGESPTSVYISSDSEPQASGENVSRTAAAGKKRKASPTGAARRARKSGRSTVGGS